MVWFLILLAAMLTAAKMTAITATAASMSWWLVTAPLWAPLAFIGALLVVAAVIAIIAKILD